MTLYVKTANAGWHRSGTMNPTDDLLIGTLTMGVNGFDPKYQEAPSYILAVYENDVLTAVRESADGTFNLTAEDNIVYNDGTTTVKAYAWNDSKLIPYLDPMNVTFPSSSGGETPAPQETANPTDEPDAGNFVYGFCEEN